MFSLVNFQDHPTNRNKKVFFFKITEHAQYFEHMLIEEKVQFEKQVDHDGDRTIYYGVKTSDFQLVKKLNYLTIGKFRKPFISDVFFRYFVIVLSIIVLSVAIIGAMISQ
ncbi:MAG: hypothetical protein RJQ00_08365 [Vicingaceae bacterium]